MRATTGLHPVNETGPGSMSAPDFRDRQERSRSLRRWRLALSMREVVLMMNSKPPVCPSCDSWLNVWHSGRHRADFADWFSGDDSPPFECHACNAEFGRHYAPRCPAWNPAVDDELDRYFTAVEVASEWMWRQDPRNCELCGTLSAVPLDDNGLRVCSGCFTVFTGAV